MSQFVNPCRSLCICAIVAAGSLFASMDVATASNIWDGGGGTDRRWSNPLNWSDDQLPSNSGTLVLSGNSTQDLFTVTGGVPNSSFSHIEGTNFFISTGSFNSALGIAAGGRIIGGGFDVPLVTAGDVQFDPPTPNGIFFRSIVQQPGAVTNVVIGSSSTPAGDMVSFEPTLAYTGTTTINSGNVLFLGGLGSRVNTSNQGSYKLGSGASLVASGTIGLTAGGQIDSAGTISTSGDGPTAALNIIGDLRVQAGSTTEILVNFTERWFNAVNATGLLDLSDGSDTLLVRVSGSLRPDQQSAVLSNYGSRMGEFDNVVGLEPWMSIAYTSAPNAGPGQVLLIVPEPASSMLGVGALSLLASRRRRFTSR